MKTLAATTAIYILLLSLIALIAILHIPTANNLYRIPSVKPSDSKIEEKGVACLK